MEVIAKLTVTIESDELLQGLARICPDEARKQSSFFKLVTRTSDPRLNQVVKFLGTKGLQPYLPGQRTDSSRYMLSFERRYDEADLNNASLLYFAPTKLVAEDQVRDDIGRLQLADVCFKKPFRIGRVLFNSTLVSADLKEAMEEAKIRGVEFREIVVAGPLAGSLRMSYWELVSRSTLPAYASISEVDEFAGHRIPIRPPELHYRKGDLEVIPPFDYAVTNEKFPAERWEIVSQQFRQFCLKQRLELEWQPVSVDEDLHRTEGLNCGSKLKTRFGAPSTPANLIPVKSPPTVPPPLPPSAGARQHHFSFAYIFIPEGATTMFSNLFLHSLIAPHAAGRMPEIWESYGRGIVSETELVSPQGLELQVYRSNAFTAFLFAFPPPERFGEAYAGLLVTPPVNQWPAEDSDAKIPVRYFVLTRTDKDSLVCEWNGGEFTKVGPGPENNDPRQFADSVLRRLYGRTTKAAEVTSTTSAVSEKAPLSPPLFPPFPPVPSTFGVSNTCSGKFLNQPAKSLSFASP